MISRQTDVRECLWRVAHNRRGGGEGGETRFLVYADLGEQITSLMVYSRK